MSTDWASDCHSKLSISMEIGVGGQMLHKQEGLDDIGAMAGLQAEAGGTLTSWRPSDEGRATEGCRGACPMGSLPGMCCRHRWAGPVSGHVSVWCSEVRNLGPQHCLLHPLPALFRSPQDVAGVCLWRMFPPAFPWKRTDLEAPADCEPAVWRACPPRVTHPSPPLLAVRTSPWASQRLPNPGAAGRGVALECGRFSQTRPLPGCQRGESARTSGTAGGCDP